MRVSLPEVSTRFVIILWLLAEVPSAWADPQQIFRDTEFSRGFVLSSSSTSERPLEIGRLAPTGTAKPAWRLAQWGTHHLLLPGPWNGSASNAAKTVAWIEPATGPGRLLLEGRADVETGGRLREKGEAWPHLLIGQRFSPPVSLKEFSSLEFNLRFRIGKVEAGPRDGAELDRRLHTAQVSAFWMVEGPKRREGEKRNRLWFGLPVFDARHPIPKGHQAPDQGQPNSSGIFIYNVDGDRLYENPTGDGKWHQLNADVLPHFEEAIAAAHGRGYWEETELEDCRLTSFNLGWELPGPYQASLEISQLSLVGDR